MSAQPEQTASNAAATHAGSQLAEELFFMLDRAARLLNNLEVLPPCIVALGNKKNGKSTLLGRIVGLPLFPCGSGLCTRMVIRVELRRGVSTMATVEVVDRTNATVPVVHSAQCAVGELAATIKDVMSEAMNNFGASAAVLLTHELRVRVQQPELPTLDLIDVPGLVATAGKEGEDTVQTTLALTKSVVERYKDTAMFLVVVDSRSGVTVSLATPLISKELAKRALGVWTKLDLFADENGKESAALEHKLKDDTLELSFGWCACCTPPCAGDNETLDQAEAAQIHEKDFDKIRGNIGLPAIRKLVEKYFRGFVNEHCLPLVLSKLNDCLCFLAASYRALGFPSGPSASRARDRALKALRSVAMYPEASRIAMELEPVSVPELVKLLEEAIEAVQGSDAGDHTSLDVPEIDAELELLRAMVAAPPEHIPLNNVAARLEERREAVAEALRRFAVFVGDTVTGRYGRRKCMLDALDSHPSKYLQRFPPVDAALASYLDVAVGAAASDVHARALGLIAANKEKLVEFRLQQASSPKTAVISTTPLVCSLAEQVFEWYLTALEQHCGWEALRQHIPSGEAAWTEVDRKASLNAIAEAAEVLKYFSDLTDDRGPLLAAFPHCPPDWTRDKPLKDWHGVTVGAAGKAISLGISSNKMCGTIDLTKLPITLVKLCLDWNHFSGPLDLTKLPATLTILHLDWNEFSGTLDLTELPTTLKELRLDWNRFSGSADLTNLPASLKELHLNKNQFKGTVDLTKLSATLRELHLNKNQFTGTLDLTKLPAALLELRLDWNQFSGSADLTKLPATLRELHLNNNRFSGTPDLTMLPATLEKLHLNWNQFSGTPDLTKLPAMLEKLYLNWNQFSGTLDLTKLPATLVELYLYGNQFSGSADLTQLPATLRELHLNKNRFTGTLDLTKLPATLVELHLDWNQFSGSVDLTKLPATLVKLHLNKNRFTGTLDLTKLPATLVELHLDWNQFSGSVDLTKLPATLVKLHLNWNRFTGTFDLAKLPATLVELYLYGNRFSGSADLTKPPATLKDLRLDNQFSV